MRKEARITIADEGRDKGKTFVLTEMQALRGEKWALRLLLAIGRTGIEIPEEAMSGGWAGLAVVGLKGMMRLSFEDAEPLLDEMFECVKIQPDGNRQDIIRTLNPDESDIEEIQTRLRLRNEVLKLHTDFSLAGVQSKPASTPAPPGS